MLGLGGNGDLGQFGRQLHGAHTPILRMELP